MPTADQADPLQPGEIVYIHGCYIYHASARPPASQSTAPHFPSSLDGMRNRKAQTGLIGVR